MYLTDSSLIVATCEAVTHTAELIQLAAPPRTRPDHLLGAGAPGSLKTPKPPPRAREAGSLTSDR